MTLFDFEERSEVESEVIFRISNTVYRVVNTNKSSKEHSFKHCYLTLLQIDFQINLLTLKERSEVKFDKIFKIVIQYFLYMDNTHHTFLSVFNQ